MPFFYYACLELGSKLANPFTRGWENFHGFPRNAFHQFLRDDCEAMNRMAEFQKGPKSTLEACFAKA